LINVHTTRKREKYAYDTFVGKFNLLIPAIEDGMDFLDALVTGESSFIQVTRHVNKLVLSAAQMKMASHMTPLIAALTQVTSNDVQADTALIEKIEQLFITFREKLV